MRLFSWKKHSTLSDVELISLYRSSGDKVHVGELYKRYAHLVYGCCLQYFRDREQARDAVVQIFEKLFDELLKREPDNFKGWLGFVARNFCISELRKMKTRTERQEAFLREEDDHSTNDAYADEETLSKETSLQRVEAAVRELSEEQRVCIELFFFKEKSYKEITEITGYPEKQVKSCIQNGKRNLKIILTRHHADQHTH